VGIGSDYQADGKYVAAPLGDAQAFERIAEELSRRGYGDSAIRKIMRANVMKILSAGPAGTGNREKGSIILHSTGDSMRYHLCSKPGSISSKSVHRAN
jgi:hypothetical protein